MTPGKVTTPFRRLLALPILLIILAIIFWPKKIDPPAAPIPPALELADLIDPPDWSQLDRFQGTISRETFFERLTTIYTKSDAWKQWISIEDNHAQIGDYRLRFSTSDQSAPGARWNWKARDLPTRHPAQPLTGYHIAIDPGHIGGDFAKLEERHHEYPGITPIQEGTMTLKTAQLLKPLLEQQGARVTLVRNTLEPLSPYSTKNFTNPVLFYRTSEIHARARLVNETIQPDLVLCLHYNGTAAKSPIPGQHFHIILNGTYAPGELSNEDERFAMLQRILSGVITEEVPLAKTIAGIFSETTGLPPYIYPPFSPFSQNIDDNPFLWVRNLLANRLYLCPVIFMEPYVMNSTEFITRFQADPEGIYREYAQAVAAGLISYYAGDQ